MSLFNKGRIHIDNDMGGCWEIKNNIHSRNKFNPLYISMIHSQKTLTGTLNAQRAFIFLRGVGGCGGGSGASSPDDPFLD